MTSIAILTSYLDMRTIYNNNKYKMTSIAKITSSIEIGTIYHGSHAENDRLIN